MKRRSVADWAKTARPSRVQCRTCQIPELAKAVREFLELAKDNPRLSLALFYREYVCREMGLGDKLGIEALYQHVRSHMQKE